MRIGIDSGHCPPGDWGAEYQKYVEYAWNRRISTEVQLLLKNKGHEIIPFCGTLFDKVQIINESEADIAVELHHNWNKNKRIRGAEVLYHPDSIEGKWLADRILKAIKESFQTRGIFAGYYHLDPKKEVLYFLQQTKMPAVIVECAYLTNSEDRYAMGETFYELRMARRITEGIQSYIKDFGR